MGVIWSDFKGKTIEQPNSSHQILVRMLLNLDFFLFLESELSTAHSKPARKKKKHREGEKKNKRQIQKPLVWNNQNGFFGRKLSSFRNLIHSLEYEAVCCIVFLMFLHIHEDVTLCVSPHRWTPPQTGPRRDELGSTRRRCPSCSTWNRGARGEW